MNHTHIKTENLLRIASMDADPEVRDAAKHVSSGIDGIVANMRHGISNELTRIPILLHGEPTEAVLDMRGKDPEMIAMNDAASLLVAGMLDEDPVVRRSSGVLYDEMNRLASSAAGQTEYRIAS